MKMSNLVQKDESETGTRHKYGVLHEGKLQLPDRACTQTIYVHAFDHGGTRIPAFALDDSGPFFPDGFKWRSAKAPLSVTFVFSPDIAGVKTSHHELQPSACSSGRQQLVIPANKAVYNFDVEFSSGDLHDPEIEVDPISP
jgi:hypothetical protein